MEWRVEGRSGERRGVEQKGVERKGVEREGTERGRVRKGENRSELVKFSRENILEYSPQSKASILRIYLRGEEVLTKDMLFGPKFGLKNDKKGK